MPEILLVDKTGYNDKRYGIMYTCRMLIHGGTIAGYALGSSEMNGPFRTSHYHQVLQRSKHTSVNETRLHLSDRSQLILYKVLSQSLPSRNVQ